MSKYLIIPWSKIFWKVKPSCGVQSIPVFLVISSQCLSFKPLVSATANSPFGLNSSTKVLYLKQIWNILSSTPSDLNRDKAELKFLINSVIVESISFPSNLLKLPSNHFLELVFQRSKPIHI